MTRTAGRRRCGKKREIRIERLNTSKPRDGEKFKKRCSTLDVFDNEERPQAITAKTRKPGTLTDPGSHPIGDVDAGGHPSKRAIPTPAEILLEVRNEDIENRGATIRGTHIENTTVMMYVLVAYSPEIPARKTATGTEKNEPSQDPAAVLIGMSDCKPQERLHFIEGVRRGVPRPVIPETSWFDRHAIRRCQPAELGSKRPDRTFKGRGVCLKYRMRKQHHRIERETFTMGPDRQSGHPGQVRPEPPILKALETGHRGPHHRANNDPLLLGAEGELRLERVIRPDDSLKPGLDHRVIAGDDRAVVGFDLGRFGGPTQNTGRNLGRLGVSGVCVGDAHLDEGVPRPGTDTRRYREKA